ncbi:polygalacturonase-like [Capsicum annuum]|uniref:polygalacturonase-like n=1 Tax=Capsicum annuum TaxID=4072 RepID=UPI001FB0A52D|nr:polygalacturonase-like [Capsicum annuum]
MMRILISFFLALLLPSLIFSNPDSPVFNVLDYGAVGNGYNDSTSAFNLTWAAACTSSSSSPTMYVPTDNTFLLHPLMLHGPCLSPDITIVINGTTIPPYRGWRWRWIHTPCIKWICIKNVNGLSVRGSGRIIYGEPPEWWEVQDRMRPASLMPLPKIIATQVFEIAHSKNMRTEIYGQPQHVCSFE